MKRDTFRRYLETNGITELISQTLAALYQELKNPDNNVEGIHFIKERMGSTVGTDEINMLKKQVETYQKANAELQRRLDQLESKQKQTEESGDPPAKEEVKTVPEESKSEAQAADSTVPEAVKEEIPTPATAKVPEETKVEQPPTKEPELETVEQKESTEKPVEVSSEDDKKVTEQTDESVAAPAATTTENPTSEAKEPEK